MHTNKVTMTRSHANGFRTALLAAGVMLASPAFAGPAPPMIEPEPVAPCGDWEWGISADYMFRMVDRSENYQSPPELWFVDYDDYEADLYGFTVFITPPNLWNTTFDFSYRSGDIQGTFMNYSLDPRPIDPGTYIGRADFDRDEFELGATVPCPMLEWIFGRLELFHYSEDGIWDYGGGYFEPQEYRQWGATLGVGAAHTFPLGGSGVTLDLAAFLGLVYFDLEHKEVFSGVTTSWDGFGFKASADARLNVPVSDCLSVFTGVGYEYLQTDDGSLESDTQGVLISRGLRGEM